MATNHTTNYELSQWRSDDQVLRADFNADNAKLDAALANLAQELDLRAKTRTVLRQVMGEGESGVSFSAQVGEPVQVETDGGLYLFVRYDLEENPQDFEGYRDSILMALKREEFLAQVDEWAAALTGVTYNEEALGRYTPEKLKFA